MSRWWNNINVASAKNLKTDKLWASMCSMIDGKLVIPVLVIGMDIVSNINHGGVGWGL